MEFEIIIAVLILSVVVIGSVVWMRKSIQSSPDATLQNELNQKRDLAAQVPLLTQRIENLEIEKNDLARSIDTQKTYISQKDVTIAENEKDRIELSKKLADKEDQVVKLESEKNELHKSIEALKSQLQQANSNIDKKEYELQQLTLGFQKDTERFNSKNSDLQNEINTHKDDLKTALKKIDALLEENTTLTSQKSVLQADLNALNENKNELLQTIKLLKDDLTSAQGKIETLQENNSELKAEKSKFQAELSAQQENNEKLKKDFEEQSKKLELKLNEIMQQNLDSKLKKFDETSMKSLDGLLKPFKENLDTFKKKVEDSQENSTKKFAELSKEIEQVTKAGMNISKEAESLTKALKGKKQMQGSWGEMILESVLEYSGLRKGVHYETQESYKDEEGNTKRPDVIIKLPQERTIIIDSKVSLNDYNNYIHAETDEERLLATNGIVTSFKNHIDSLDSKDYAHYKVGTLQYVFMFVPIEGAFAMAIQQDPKLYEYALKKHIAIVNPSTLTVSLRTIYLYWQSEQSNTLASKLFDEAGKLYDKMVGFSDSFGKIGKQLQSATNTYEHAHKQLTEGPGNLMGKVENLKRLGARTSKTLKDSKMEFQDFDEVEMEIELLPEPVVETLSSDDE
ncbi:MAG: DNA recombination protein RmuC [Sulfuricurvum sp.]|nr:DNA recombination protein RmuC [Sulfuricurvum sp.]